MKGNVRAEGQAAAGTRRGVQVGIGVYEAIESHRRTRM